MEAYEDCISSLREAQTRRRTSSLKRISPANFTKEVALNSFNFSRLFTSIDDLLQIISEAAKHLFLFSPKCILFAMH